MQYLNTEYSLNGEFKIRNLNCFVKHGGTSVMIWRYIFAAGVDNLKFIKDNIDKHVHLNIVKENIKSSAERLGILYCFKFSSDNPKPYRIS